MISTDKPSPNTKKSQNTCITVKSTSTGDFEVIELHDSPKESDRLKSSSVDSPRKYVPEPVGVFWKVWMALIPCLSVRKPKTCESNTEDLAENNMTLSVCV
eukprot:232178_1